MITKVSSFKTSDEKLHNTRADALKHQLMLNLRGVIQETERGHTTYTATQLAGIVVSKMDTISDLVKRYRMAVNGTRRAGIKRKDKATVLPEAAMI